MASRSVTITHYQAMGELEVAFELEGTVSSGSKESWNRSIGTWEPGDSGEVEILKISQLTADEKSVEQGWSYEEFAQLVGPKTISEIEESFVEQAGEDEEAAYEDAMERKAEERADRDRFDD